MLLCVMYPSTLDTEPPGPPASCGTLPNMKSSQIRRPHAFMSGGMCWERTVAAESPTTRPTPAATSRVIRASVSLTMQLAWGASTAVPSIILCPNEPVGSDLNASPRRTRSLVIGMLLGTNGTRPASSRALMVHMRPPALRAVALRSAPSCSAMAGGAIASYVCGGVLINAGGAGGCRGVQGLSRSAVFMQGRRGADARAKYHWIHNLEDE